MGRGFDGSPLPDLDRRRARLVGDDHVLRPRAVHSHCNLLPPRAPRTLARAKPQRHAIIGDATFNGLPQARPANLKPIVEIQFAPAILARVDVELQRTLWALSRTLHQRLPRQDRPSADEHRDHAELGRLRELVLPDRKARPIIVPAASRQADRLRLGRFRAWRSGDDEIAPYAER